MVGPSTVASSQSSLLVGGLTASGTFDAQVWSLAPDRGWEPFKTTSNEHPPARWKGSFSRVDDSNAVLFAGSNDKDYFNDAWMLKVSRNTPSIVVVYLV